VLAITRKGQSMEGDSQVSAFVQMLKHGAASDDRGCAVRVVTQSAIRQLNSMEFCEVKIWQLQKAFACAVRLVEAFIWSLCDLFARPIIRATVFCWRRVTAS
jgi:hypothetical protein